MTAPGIPGTGRLVTVTSAGDKQPVRTVRMTDDALAWTAGTVNRRRDTLLGPGGTLTAVVDGRPTRTWRLA